MKMLFVIAVLLSTSASMLAADSKDKVTNTSTQSVCSTSTNADKTTLPTSTKDVDCHTCILQGCECYYLNHGTRTFCQCGVKKSEDITNKLEPMLVPSLGF